MTDLAYTSSIDRVPVGINRVARFHFSPMFAGFLRGFAQFAAAALCVLIFFAFTGRWIIAGLATVTALCVWSGA